MSLMSMPNQSDVMKALDNMTTADMSNCNNNKNNSSGNTSLQNSTVCTDVTGRGKKMEKMKIQSMGIKVGRCDDVLYIKGAQKLKDYDDCGSREPGFFTMSMFMVNYFRQNMSHTLEKSILIQDMNSLPGYVPGTQKKCLDFVDGRTPGSFAICFEDPMITQSLFNAFMNYMKCRMGDNLVPLTLPQLKRLYELTCAGKPIDPKIIFSADKGLLITGIKKNLSNKLNPYYSVLPPGHAPEEKKVKKNPFAPQGLSENFVV